MYTFERWNSTNWIRCWRYLYLWCSGGSEGIIKFYTSYFHNLICFFINKPQKILINARKNSKKIIFLVTDGYSNGKDPVPIATKLKEGGVTIFTIGISKLSNKRFPFREWHRTKLYFFSKGIQSGNYIELYNISSAPEEGHSFLLDSFSHFESLARKALHAGEWFFK